MKWDEVCFGELACDRSACPAMDPVEGAQFRKANLICPSKTGVECCGNPMCFFNCNEDTMMWEGRCKARGECDSRTCSPKGGPVLSGECEVDFCTQLKTQHVLLVMARLTYQCPNQAGKGRERLLGF